MPRRRRIIFPGLPHHVTHRGNRKTAVYSDDEDRQFYLKQLQKFNDMHQIDIYSYCLMHNHIHLVAVPETKQGLSRFMHDLHGSYATYFNVKYRLSGHLWQERFYACALYNDHLWNAIRYIEQNPVRARIIRVAEQYPWSSAAAHCGLKSDVILGESFTPLHLMENWSQWLASRLSDDDLERIRSATWKGIPCASTAFLQELESLLGIPLLPHKPGRKSNS